MNASLKSKLLEVPVAQLVDLIFDLADESDVSWSKIERLVSKPNENSKRFLRRLEEIKNRGGFVPWKYSSKFADEMTDILADLEVGVSSVEEGFKLICEFYRADASFFEQADDSSGHIGDVFRSSAVDIFVKYAAHVSDRKLVINELLELLKDDGYGVRDDLISHAYKFLTNAELKKLFDIFDSLNAVSKEKYSDCKLTSIAKQLKDASLFETVAKRGKDELNSKDLLEIAEIHFLSENYEEAQKSLDSIKDSDHFSRHEQEDLQKKIYSKLGKTEQLFKIVFDAFHKSPCEYTLRDLIAVDGPSRRSELVADAVKNIMAKKTWSSSDAEFLMYIGDDDSLESYVLLHRSKLQEGIFYSASSIAECLVQKSKYLAATLVYRSLITETLKKSISKYYHHAVNYLEVLDLISNKIDFWDGIEDHKLYLESLKMKHALKKSLWSKYKK
jgi:hypothetical protein